MTEVLISVGLGVGGAIAIWGLYRAMQLTWPEQYMSLNDTFALRITQTWWRLALYRSLPVFFAMVAIGTTADRLDGIAAIAIWVAAVLHVATSNLRALLEAFGVLRRSPQFAVNYASWHLVTIGVVLASTVAAQWLQPMLVRLVPRPSVLLENVWIAVFIAIVGGIAVGIIGRRPNDAMGFGSDYLIWRATRDVGIDLLDEAFKAAESAQCDPILLRAIIFTEALQRPRWVRNLERAKGLVIRRGTYGVAQVSADKPISDQESIVRAAHALSGAWAIQPGETGWVVNEDLLWRASAQHNEDLAFIEGVRRIYFALQMRGYELPRFPDTAPVYLVELRRYPQQVGLRVVSSAQLLGIRFTDPDGAEASELKVQPDNTINWATEFQVPMGTASVVLFYVSHAGSKQFTYPIRASELPAVPTAR